MAPIYVKGGVWTNVEDEVLKAAVSKYGLNQWARVASLLTKKSAKQAKARWTEWLSPNIDKSEWSREEDEKLLGIAKLLPNQWRSIAPIMGRTATHCAERYQKLLDDASEHADKMELSAIGPGIESLPASGPSGVGELNVNPESRPAKPDEENMDDEEREMLSEARARLANTQGKKAKRKERERMLEESKRIALLQKRRELKAAGINASLESRNKKKTQFDYNADIPFEHEPQAGIYDVSEELEANEAERRNFNRDISKTGMNLQEVSDQHKKIALNKEKQNSISKRKNKDSLQAAAEVINELERDKLKRRKLDLPEPSNLSSELNNLSDNDVEMDVDDRIFEATKELIASQAEKSSLLAEPSSISKDNLVLPKKEQVNIAPSSKKKSIIEFLKTGFSSFPTPHNQFKIVLPSFDSSEEVLTATTELEDIGDQGERIRKLEILRQVDEEKSKLRRSQAVQLGLPIPNPKFFNKLDLSKYCELDKLVIQELEALIKSDYSKYENSSFQADLLEDLDETTYDKVKSEIAKELQIMSEPKERADFSDFTLDKSFDTAVEIVHKLHASHNKTASMENAFKSSSEYSSFQEKEKELILEIRKAYDDLHNAEIEHSVLSSILQEEESIIENRSKALHMLVDKAASVESFCQQRLRDLRIKLNRN